VCDLETSRMGAPYIYIYDISRLRVNRKEFKAITMIITLNGYRKVKNVSEHVITFDRRGLCGL